MSNVNLAGGVAFAGLVLSGSIDPDSVGGLAEEAARVAPDELGVAFELPAVKEGLSVLTIVPLA
jgi:hypothetical protein